MRNQADRKRYLIGLLGERGKGKKKKSRRIQNRRESRVGTPRNSFEEAKERERTEEERGLCLKKM
jgi:hypothetical protein